MERRHAFTIDLVIGMASTGAVPIWDHLEFQALVGDGRFTCKYLIAKVPLRLYRFPGHIHSAGEKLAMRCHGKERTLNFQRRNQGTGSPAS